MGLKDFLNRVRERKKLEQDYEDNQRAVSNVNQRKVSHNERVLLKLLEEERQKHIKETLKWEVKKRNLEDKKKAKDMLRFDSTLFRNKNILNEHNQFLRGDD